MMSINDLAHFLGIGTTTAWEEMQKLPHTTIGNGLKYKTRRVSKEGSQKAVRPARPKSARVEVGEIRKEHTP